MSEPNPNDFLATLGKFQKILVEAQGLINSYEDIKRMVLETTALMKQLKMTGDILQKIVENVNKLGTLIETKLKGGQ